MSSSDPIAAVDVEGVTCDVRCVSEAKAERAHSGPDLRSKWLPIIIAGAVLLAVITDPDSLVERVPIPYAVVIGVLGFGGGLYAVIRINPPLEKRGWRGYLAIIALPFIALFIASLLGRMAFETAAFAGVAPSQMNVEAPIVDMISGRSGPHAEVKIEPASREFRVSVTHDLYARLDAYRYPGRDCLTLTVQTGRFGVRRALIPAPLSRGLGPDHLHPCPAEVTTWAAIRDGS